MGLLVLLSIAYQSQVEDMNDLHVLSVGMPCLSLT